MEKQVRYADKSRCGVRLTDMDTSELLSSIDSEIARLREARALLAGKDAPFPFRTEKKKRHMSADSRARIAAAQKKRWAAWKRAKKAA